MVTAPETEQSGAIGESLRVTHREDLAICILLLRHGNQLFSRHHIRIIQPQICQPTLRTEELCQNSYNAYSMQLLGRLQMLQQQDVLQCELCGHPEHRDGATQ